MSDADERRRWPGAAPGVGFPAAARSPFGATPDPFSASVPSDYPPPHGRPVPDTGRHPDHFPTAWPPPQSFGHGGAPPYPPVNPGGGLPFYPPAVGWGGAPGPYPPFPTRPGRRRWMVACAVAAVAVAVVAGVIIWLIRPEPSRPATLALTELADGVQIGYAGAATTIDIFDEPICPPCGRFVTSSSADIHRAINDKKVAVRYHLLNFLDHNSASGDYSTRAVAASYCVAAANEPKVYLNFYADLFGANFQPEEGARTDRTDTEMADLAQSVGAPRGALDCIRSGELVGTAKAKADNAQTALEQLEPEVRTPVVFNGTSEVDTSAAGWVERLSQPA
jgi:serine/threonine-protein kinase